MLKGIISRQKGIIILFVLLCDKAFILGEHIVQQGFLFFDLIYHGDHGIVIRSHNVRESQIVNIHGRLGDLRKPAFSRHKIVGNVGCVGIYIMYVNNS